MAMRTCPSLKLLQKLLEVHGRRCVTLLRLAGSSHPARHLLVGGVRQVAVQALIDGLLLLLLLLQLLRQLLLALPQVGLPLRHAREHGRGIRQLSCSCLLLVLLLLLLLLPHQMLLDPAHPLLVSIYISSCFRHVRNHRTGRAPAIQDAQGTERHGQAHGNAARHPAYEH